MESEIKYIPHSRGNHSDDFDDNEPCYCDMPTPDNSMKCKEHGIGCTGKHDWGEPADKKECKCFNLKKGDDCPCGKCFGVAICSSTCKFCQPDKKECKPSEKHICHKRCEDMDFCVLVHPTDCPACQPDKQREYERGRKDAYRECIRNKTDFSNAVEPNADSNDLLQATVAKALSKDIIPHIYKLIDWEVKEK